MNIPQRARELADKLTDNIECEISLVDEKGSARIVDVESLILAFAAEVERDALERALNVVKSHRANWGLNPVGKGAGKVLDNVMAIETAIRALTTIPTPERQDPTVALAKLFQSAIKQATPYNYACVSPVDLIASGLARWERFEEKLDLTPLGHEALRIAKENDHG